MTTTSSTPTPATPEKKAPIVDRVDSAVDKAQVKLDAVIDAAQDKVRAVSDRASTRGSESRDAAKQHAVDALDATQTQVDRAVGKAKDALQK